MKTLTTMSANIRFHSSDRVSKKDSIERYAVLIREFVARVVFQFMYIAHFILLRLSLITIWTNDGINLKYYLLFQHFRLISLNVDDILHLLSF